ncbi:MAG: hypothetical protein QOG10_2439 [Kribbellaceae bacterium]|nr:hypothetical protein [Kribbellaceae bacterium]
MTHRRFWLDRQTDISGVSGIGEVAEGIQFTDGSIALRWISATPCTAVFDHLDQVAAVHGHGGVTTIRWLDPVPLPPHDLLSRAAGLLDTTPHHLPAGGWEARDDPTYPQRHAP